MNKYAKAIVGAIVAGLGVIYLGLDDGVMSLKEWVACASTTITALGVVWGVPNVDKTGRNLSQSTSTTSFTVSE